MINYKVLLEINGLIIELLDSCGLFFVVVTTALHLP